MRPMVGRAPVRSNGWTRKNCALMDRGTDGMTRARVQAALAEAVVRALAEGDVLALQPLVAPDVVDHSAQPGQPAGWPGSASSP